MQQRLALFAIAACVVFMAALFPSLVAYGHDSPVANPDDFRAFYCAGRAVAARKDPYRVQPLWGCELAALRSNGLSAGDGRVMPAPLPPYALALFAAVSRLPFPAAAILWDVAGLAAIVCGGFLISRLTGFPLGPTALALAPAEICGSLWLGQVVPFVVCALCVAALALRARRYGAAAAALLFATIEPHVALPACLAVAVFVPAMRRPLAVAAAVAAAVALAAVGPAVCFEYVTSVLPLHARSEIVNFGAQYSLTSLLWAYGFSPDAALRIGEFASVLVVAAGIALARRPARRFGDPAFFVLVPCTAVLFGSAFIHIHQMSVAVPCALLLWSRVRPRGLLRAAFFTGTLCLAVPWLALLGIPAIADRLPAAGPPHAVSLAAPVPADFAELPRTRYLEAVVGRYHHPVWFDTLVKVPTWLGLGFTLLFAGVAAGAGSVEPAGNERGAARSARLLSGRSGGPATSEL